MSQIEYVIYCRKSSDEKSDNQKQSIPDQIRACMEYAKREGFTIKKKPKNFGDFETLLEIDKEDNEADIANRRTYQETREYFIIKEEKTGKIPGARNKWKALIKLVKVGKINGIISYSPDRQARNMLDGGELIDLVDQNKLKENKQKGITVLDLKYTNFHFEDNAAGKMMLGIWFVFSKQYSDKLGEDITRGNDSKVASGKAIGKHKPGYQINKHGYHEPHPKFFDLIKEAFEMKLNNVAESKIKEFLDANGYYRLIGKTQKKSLISTSRLNLMFKDEFYYGVFVNGQMISDLRETNPDYKVMITEEQFQIIMNRYNENPITKGKSKVIDEHDEIRVCENDFIKSEDNFHFTLSIPNKKRYNDKITKLLTQGKKATLADVIAPHQIHYVCANKNSKYHKITITQVDIDNAVLEALQYFKVDKKAFDEYIEFCNTRLDEIQEAIHTKVSKKNLEIGRVKAEKLEYIKDHMKLKNSMDVEENEIYENARKEYDRKINILRKEIESLDESERDEILELEVFIDLLNKAEELYQKASYVRKRKICKILFSNIKITHEKRLQIQPKAGLETLFTHHWWS